MTSPSLLAAGMAADNLAMAVYFSIIMSIPAGGDESTLESLAGILFKPLLKVKEFGQHEIAGQILSYQVANLQLLIYLS